MDPCGRAVVTLTTHGGRVRDVWLVIESIARGFELPARLILYLDQGVKPPRRLRWLRRRGLEIRWADPRLRSYKKFWPYLQQEGLDLPMVLADDDVIYPAEWLRGLLLAHDRYPDDVIAYRAHRITLSAEDEILPYAQWVSCDDDEPRFSNFATGVSGVLYPIAVQTAVKDAGDAFMELSPSADDVWLHRTAVNAGHRTRHVLPGQRHWPFVPGSQIGGLSAANIAGGGNDRQIAASYTSGVLGRIRSDAPRRPSTRIGSEYEDTRD